MNEFPTHVLNTQWMHSHEEDTGQDMVFRPADYKFPPSRGRTGFELRQDGTAVSFGIAPTDAPKQNTGSWSLSDEGHLRLDLAANNESRVYQLVSADPDRLVVKRA